MKVTEKMTRFSKKQATDFAERRLKARDLQRWNDAGRVLTKVYAESAGLRDEIIREIRWGVPVEDTLIATVGDNNGLMWNTTRLDLWKPYVPAECRRRDREAKQQWVAQRRGLLSNAGFDVLPRILSLSDEGGSLVVKIEAREMPGLPRGVYTLNINRNTVEGRSIAHLFHTHAAQPYHYAFEHDNENKIIGLDWGEDMNVQIKVRERWSNPEGEDRVLRNFPEYEIERFGRIIPAFWAIGMICENILLRGRQTVMLQRGAFSDTALLAACEPDNYAEITESASAEEMATMAASSLEGMKNP